MREQIELIINKYKKEYEGISCIRYDEMENEFWIEKELEELFNEKRIKAKIKRESIYCKCSLEICNLSIAYIDKNDNIELLTYKLYMR